MMHSIDARLLDLHAGQCRRGIGLARFGRLPSRIGLGLLLLRSKKLVLPEFEARAIEANREGGELDLVF